MQELFSGAPLAGAAEEKKREMAYKRSQSMPVAGGRAQGADRGGGVGGMDREEGGSGVQESLDVMLDLAKKLGINITSADDASTYLVAVTVIPTTVTVAGGRYS